MSSLKIVQTRMRSVASIRKITKAMKMVAASKLRGDETRLLEGSFFTSPFTHLFSRIPIDTNIRPGTTHFIIGITSDKGLCGGVNSAVCKKSKQLILETEEQGGVAHYCGIGSKGSNIMKRTFSDKILLTFEDISKVPINFSQASVIANTILSRMDAASGAVRASIVGNVSRSAISYDTVCRRLVTKSMYSEMDRTEWSKSMDLFSYEPPIFELLPDMYEMYIATSIYHALLDSVKAEQSSRMSAMENASRNAGEMLDKLTIQYNKARQAKITTELCEIISGASSM